MSRQLCRHLLFLGCIFALTRAWPLSVSDPWNYWEVFEAKKLNYYGWAERRGALLDIHYLAGVVPRPEMHNYSNHPAPIHWVNMVVHWAMGEWGVIATGTLIGLGACLATLFALRQFYSGGIAFVGALIFAIAPTSIIYDVDPNQGALGTIAWPFAALALAPSLPIGRRAWLLGATCFFSGQASWMVWIIFGAMLIGVSGVSLAGRFRAAPQRRSVTALLVGGGLTVLFFALQVVFYTTDWEDLRRYLTKQSVEQVGLIAWLVRASTRSAMSLGPALIIGALAGLITIFIERKAQPLELVALGFLPLFGAASFVLRGFFQSENWPYEYLVFPASVLSCAFLASLPAGRSWSASVVTLLVLSVVGLPYVFLRFSNPSLSVETRFIADLMAAQAQPHEIVVTNMVDQVPPLQPWNVSGLGVAMHKADRLMRTNVADIRQLSDLLSQFHSDTLEVVYIRTRQQHVEPDLSAILDSAPYRKFAIPAHEGPLPFSLQIRNFYWSLTGRHQAPVSKARLVTSKDVELSRLRISKSRHGGITIEARPTSESVPAEVKSGNQ